jgi:HPt (histidine-containing phosphotransfer) domain-containing protein
LLRKWLARDKDVRAPLAKVPAAARHDLLASIDAAAVASLRKLRANTHADLYTKLVELFRSGSAESLAQLNAALAATDLTAAAAICHKLASSAANVGALAYGRELRRLEQLCSSGNHAKALAVNEMIQAAHPPLMQALLGLTLRAVA